MAALMRPSSVVPRRISKLRASGGPMKRSRSWCGGVRFCRMVRAWERERTIPSRGSMRVPSRSRKILEITFRIAAYLLRAEALRHSCATLLRRPNRLRVRSSHIAGERFQELRLRLVLDHLPVSHDDPPNGPFCDPAQAPRSFRMIPQEQ